MIIVVNLHKASVLCIISFTISNFAAVSNLLLTHADIQRSGKGHRPWDSTLNIENHSTMLSCWGAYYPMLLCMTKEHFNDSLSQNCEPQHGRYSLKNYFKSPRHFGEDPMLIPYAYMVEANILTFPIFFKNKKSRHTISNKEGCLL